MTWQAAFEDQARSCAALGSDFTARLLSLIAERGLPPGRISDRITSWPGDLTSRGDSVPLRLAGALHGLVIEARDPVLAQVYPPNRAPESAIAQAVDAVLLQHEDWLLARLAAAPQTNEVRRASVLIAAARWLTARHGLPIVLSELGASAGLNLLFDRFQLHAGGQCFGPADQILRLDPDWLGPLPCAAEPRIEDRAGVDLAPLDPVRDRMRLLSYIWADQPDRLTRTDAALSAAARLKPRIDRGDAVDWLEQRLADPMPDRLHLVYHTVAWQYFPAEAQARGEALLAEAGARASETAPLARFAMEADDTPGGAALSLQLWPEAVKLDLGRADFHGRWVRWRAPE